MQRATLELRHSCGWVRHYWVRYPSHRADDVVERGDVGPQPSRGFGGHLEPSPENGNGELGVRSGGQPETEVLVGLTDAQILHDLCIQMVVDVPSDRGTRHTRRKQAAKTEVASTRARQRSWDER